MIYGSKYKKAFKLRRDTIEATNTTIKLTIGGMVINKRKLKNPNNPIIACLPKRQIFDS